MHFFFLLLRLHPNFFFLIPFCPGAFRPNAAAVGRGGKMAVAAFARAVRAAPGQWKARRSIYPLTEGGTGAGWSRRLAWRLTGKKRPEDCPEFSPGLPVFGRSHRRFRTLLDPGGPGCPPVSASLPAPGHSALARKQTRTGAEGGEGEEKSPC